VAAIIARGNRMVPEVVAAACDQAGVRPRDLKLLVTNQPNAVFLRKRARGARAFARGPP
jgi:3-oxoacyl-[acyl-carrier-protein] synthase-3